MRVICFRGKYSFLSNYYRDEAGFQVEELYQAQKRHKGDLETMERLERQKYANPRTRKMLLDTKEAELIEGNWWKDCFWGQCPIGKGRNELGKMLMRLRAEFQIEKEKENAGN